MDLYAVKIRRDANTITPVDVPKHEIAILQELFGEENVQTILGLSIEEQGLGKAVATIQTPDDEYGRLVMKYGQKAVEDVYGKKATFGLQTAMDKIAADEAKTAAKESVNAKPSHGLKVDEIKAELAKREITIPEGVTRKEDLAKLLDEAPESGSTAAGDADE